MFLFVNYIVDGACKLTIQDIESQQHLCLCLLDS